VSDTDLLDQIRIFLPKYLSPAEQTELYDGLRAFPSVTNYYTQHPDLKHLLLQGDGWRGLLAIDFETLEKRPVSGVVLSNSCDISEQNPRALPARLQFAPLIRLSKYRELLVLAGKSDTQIASLFDAIRRQQTTSMFYFPSFGIALEESIALFDTMQSIPLSAFLEAERSKVFTLSQLGHWILLIKLSIHFSRFQEGVSRHS
jgi:hypothetical protein